MPTKIVTDGNNCRQSSNDGIVWSEYSASIDSLSKLLSHPNFCRILDAKNLLITDDASCTYKGGFSLVLTCKNDTVVKLTSARILSATPDDVEFLPDLTPTDDEPEYDVACIKAHIEREAFSYKMLETERRNSLAAPFLIPLYKAEGEKVYDYLIAINLPLYEKLEDRLTGFNEQEVLKMVRDVLLCLKSAHSKNLRHWDIKPENIMYDASAKKYVLIDWGTSCNLSDNEFVRNAFRRPIAQAGTEGYIDPLRIVKKAEEPFTDLYSLGVVMAILAHKNGFWSGTSFSEFLKAADEKDCLSYVKISDDVALPYFTEKICGELNCSSGYANLVKNTLLHNYAEVEDMLDDIAALMPDSKEDRKTVKKADVRVNSVLSSIVSAILITLITFILSGGDGVSSNITGEDNSVISWTILAICAVFPLLMLVAKNGGRTMTMEIKLSSLLVGATVFFAITLSSWYVLSVLDIKSPMILNSVAFLVSIIITSINAKCGKKNMLTAALISGALTGFSMALSVTVCLSTKNLADIFSVPYVEFMLYAAVFGLILGAFAWYLAFLWRTRCKKSH